MMIDNFHKIKSIVLWLMALLISAGCSGGGGGGDSVSETANLSFVTPIVETSPVPNSGDAADDICIWVHPTDSSQSTIIGTDKLGGLAVYDILGSELYFLPDGRMNNVDVRYNFPLGNELVDLVVAGNRTDDSLAIYKVLPATRELEDVAAQKIFSGIEVYGSCMYKSNTTEKYYLFITAKSGEVEQWELIDNGAAKVDAFLVRTFNVGSQSEGCVADDQFAKLYIGEENVAIWKYGAEPWDSNVRTLVDLEGQHFKAAVEGLTIYYTSEDTGYLIASSQGNSRFVIYERELENQYIGTFAIQGGIGIDAVSGTDGIDVTNVNMGALFPVGFFIAQDHTNPGENQNFKLVPWNEIAATQIPLLSIDTGWNPRQ